MKYCGIATPFRGIIVYTRSAMGMPGYETALEELMCHVLASSSKEDVQQNSPTISIVVATLRKNSSPTVHALWKLLTDATCHCLHLHQVYFYLGLDLATTLLVCKPRRVSALTSCPPPESIRGLRSFIGANKPLAVSSPTAPNLSIHSNLPWPTYNLMTFFSWMTAFAKNLLPPKKPLTRKSLLSFLVPLINLYATPQDRLLLAGFYSANLRKHQATW